MAFLVTSTKPELLVSWVTLVVFYPPVLTVMWWLANA
jgi:hypothetical protein